MGCPYNFECDEQDENCVVFFAQCRKYRIQLRRDDDEPDKGLSVAERNTDSATGKILK